MATIKTLIGNVKGKDGGGYEEVILYDGNCSACINSDIITASSPMIKLSDSIEKYKSIRIEFISFDGKNNYGVISTSTTYSVNHIKNNYTFSCIKAYSSSNPNFYSAQGYGFYDDTHLTLCWENYAGWEHNTSHIIVTGIRDKVSDAEKNFNKYSTTEEVVGTWIDGKPLYRKVIQTIISDGGIVLSDANCILVRYEWYAPVNGIKLLKLPAPNAGNAALWQLDNGNIVFNIPGSSDVNGKLATCILEYTKTTD